MVDSQVRPDRIVDPRLIRAMRTLPRERFVPPGRASMAYIDEDVRLPNGRALMEPRVLAHLVQSARVRVGDRVLVVGAGTGYGAAVFARLGAIVTALEDDEGLLAIARAVLPDVAPSVTIQVGPLTAGLPGPWDVIMIEGAVSEIPPAIGQTLNHQGGRAGHGIGAERRDGEGRVGRADQPGRAGRHAAGSTAIRLRDADAAAFKPVPTFQF